MSEDTNAVEQELIEVSKFKPRSYPDRQDELAALLRAVEKISDKLFNDLSTEAADWYDNAAEAINNHEDIPDFEEPSDDPDEDDAEDTSDDHDHEADEAAEDADEDVNEGSIEEDEPDDEPAPPKKGKANTKAPEPVEAPTPKPAKKSKAKPVAKEPAAGSTDEEVPSEIKKPKKTYKTSYDKLTGEKDKFGLFIGTQTQKAVQMYEKGSTVKGVTELLGGKYRNILTKLAKEGHLIEKLEGGVYKVTHKAEFEAADKKGKKEVTVFYVDTEFNGHEGQLISLALVSP